MNVYSRLLLIFTTSVFLTGCLQEAVPESFTLISDSGKIHLYLDSPIASPSNLSNNPRFRVTNTTAGSTVYLYNNATCNPGTHISYVTSSGGTVYISHTEPPMNTAPMNDGDELGYYAKQIDANLIESNCTPAVTYKFDATNAGISSFVVTSTPQIPSYPNYVVGDATPNLEVQVNEANGLVNFYEQGGCLGPAVGVPVLPTGIVTYSDTSISSMSSKTYSLEFIDEAGNSTGCYGTDLVYLYDGDGPVISVTSPAAGSTVGSNIIISGNCEGPIDLTISGVGGSLAAPITNVLCNAGTTFSQSLTLIGTGSRFVDISQVDQLGNNSTVRVSYMVDNTGPALTVVPADNATVGSSVIISGNCETGGPNFQVSGPNLTGSPVVMSCVGSSYTQSISFSASGAQTITVSQEDSFGNSSSVVRNFTVDGTGPAITVAPIENAVVPVTVTVSGSCETSGSQVTIAGPIMGSPVSTSCASSNYSRSVTFTASGSQVISVSQMDALLNPSSVNRTLDVQLANLSIDQAPFYDFGNIVNGGSQTHAFTINNIGVSAASGMGGSGLAAPFSFAGGSYPGGGTCSATLAAGSSCTVIIQYSPSSVGPHSDTMNIDYNNGLVAGQVATRDVQGTGVSAAMLLISETDPYDFGSIVVGGSQNHSFTVTNTGGSTATAMGGSGLASPFSFAGGSYPGGGTCGATLSAGDSCTVIIQYAPASVGPHFDTINIDYNNGLVAGQVATRDVQGTGLLAALLSISNGPTYDYGSRTVGGSYDQTFTVTNSGGASATAMGGSGLAAPFSFKGGGYPGTGGSCGPFLAGGGTTCTIVVTYSPASLGPHSDTINIDYNNGLVAGQVAARGVQGTALSAALLSINNGPAYDYGSRTVGGSYDQTFTVTNSGETTATAMGGSGLAAPFSFVGGSYPGGGTCGATLAGGGATCTIVVRYSPASVGPHSDTINIDYNDGLGSLQATRNVDGTGLSAANLTISEVNPYNFPALANGGSQNHSFTVTNTGGSNATAMGGSGLASPFSFAGGSYPGGGTCGAMLSAGGSCTVIIQYAPTVSGSHLDTFDIIYDNGVLAGQISSRDVAGTSYNPATQFVIINPSDSIAGTATTVTVQAQDSGGALVTNYFQDVTLNVSGSATGGGIVDIVNGVGSLPINDLVAETVVLTLSDSQGTGLSVSSTQNVVFAHGPINTLSFNVQPVNTVAGQNILVSVEALDSLNNRVTTGVDSTANVTLSLQSGTGTLLGTVTKSLTAGLVSFNAGDDVRINVVGAKVLRATDGTRNVDSNVFNIINGPAFAIAFTVQPTNSNAGADLLPVVTIYDQFSNVVQSGAGSSQNVTIAINTQPGGATLAGTTVKSAVAGVAAWTATDNLSLNIGGAYTLVASIASPVVTDISASFNITVPYPPFSWTGAAGNGQWSTAANWSTSIVPGTNDTALFNGACSGADCNLTLSANIDVGGIHFANDYTGNFSFGAGSHTIRMNGLNVEALNINFSSATITILGNMQRSGFMPIASASTVRLTGASSTISDDFDFYNLYIGKNVAETLNLNSNTMYVSNDLEIECPASNTPAMMSIDNGVIEVQQNLRTISSGFSCGGGDLLIRLNGTTNANVDSSNDFRFRSLEVEKIGASVTFLGTVRIEEDLRFISATSISTFSSYFIFSGNQNSTIDASGFYLRDVLFQKADGYHVTLDSEMYISGDVDINQGPTSQMLNETLYLSGSFNMLAGGGGSTDIYFEGGANQNIFQSNSAAEIPGDIIVNKLGEKVTQNSPIYLPSGNLSLSINQKWLMSDYQLSVNSLSLGNGSGIYKGCPGSAQLLVNSISVPEGVYDSGFVTGGIPVQLSVNDQVANEGQSLMFTVSQTPTNCVATNFYFAVNDDTAVAGSDFNVPAGPFSIPASTAFATVPVPALFDANTTEGAETFNIEVGRFNSPHDTAVGTINNFVPVPTITVENTFVYEGKTANVRVRLSNASLSNVTFDWSTSNWSAIAGEDYTAASGTSVTILAGNTYIDLPINTQLNTQFNEGLETFRVDIWNAFNTTNSSSVGDVNIADSHNGIYAGLLKTSNVFENQMTIDFSFIGDKSYTGSSADVYICNATLDPGCVPVYYDWMSSMGAPNDRYFSRTIFGLNPSTQYKIRVNVFDPDGVAFFHNQQVNYIEKTFRTADPGGMNRFSISNPVVVDESATGFHVQVDWWDDSNSNGNATLYYCNANLSDFCDPLAGNTAAMPKAFAPNKLNAIVSGLAAPNLQGHKINYAVVLTDADGVYGSAIYGRLSLGSSAKPVYRSVGFNEDAPLACGMVGMNCPPAASGMASVVSGQLTVASSMPNKVGVGDYIVFDSDNNGSFDTGAFIHSRVSATQFQIRNALGENPPNTASNTATWKLYRAYQYLSSAENGDENNGILNQGEWCELGCGSLINFDVWSGGNNLLADDLQWNIALYTGDHSGSLTLSGWNTSKYNFIRIFTPMNANEVGVSQRHNGTVNCTNCFRLSTTMSLDMINIQADHVAIDGLVLMHMPNVGGYSVIALNDPLDASGFLKISNNIITFAGQMSPSLTGFRDNFGSHDQSRVYFWNNIIANLKNAGSVAYAGLRGQHLIYNNTIVNINGYGFDFSGSSGASQFVLKNNIVQGTMLDAYYNCASCALSSTNLSDDFSGFGTNQFNNRLLDFNEIDENDFRLSFYDNTEARNAGLDLSSDISLAFTKDIQGKNRTAPWSLGASIYEDHEEGVIYRSLGASRTSALASTSGGANNLSIDGNRAIFNSDLPMNIGVGDVIVYDTNMNSTLGDGDSLAVIYKRINNRTFGVRNPAGLNPTAMPSRNYWGVFRAYTSLANSFSGTENIGLPGATLRNFDVFGSPHNLVAANRVWKIALYGETNADTTAATVSNWTTSETNYLHLFSPYKKNHVAVSQKHSGVFDTAFYNMSVSSSTALTVAINHAVIEGMQINKPASTSFNRGISVNNSSGANAKVVIRNNIVKMTSNANNGHAGIEIIGSNVNLVTHIHNNIIYGFNNASSVGIVVARPPSFVYNNTIVDSTSGIAANNSGVTAKNNIVNSSGAAYVTSANFTAESERNISNDSTYPNNVGSNFTFTNTTFVNPANFDYRLDNTDWNARNQGRALNYDTYLPFDYDISGWKRKNFSAEWDIGAHETIANWENPIMTLSVSVNSTAGVINSQVNYTGDSNSNSDAEIRFCNHTVIPNCDPMGNAGNGMSDYGGYYQYSVPSITYGTIGDTIRYVIIVSDPDGVQYGVRRGEFIINP